MNPRNRFKPHTASKQVFLAAVLLGLFFSGYAQTTIAVAPTKMNLFYIGVDNPVSIAASGSTDDEVTVSITGGDGTISKVGAGLYNVRVASITDECKVSVFVNGKLSGTSAFRVRPLPVPVATIGGYRSGDKLAATVLRSQAGVGVYVKDCPLDVQYQILGFALSIYDENGKLETAACEGAYFSPEVKNLINQYAKAGRTVTVDQLRVKDPGGREFKLPSIMYYMN